MKETRKCTVRWSHKTEEGNFVQYGTRIIYDDGNNPLQKSSAIVEMEDGQVVEVDPSQIKFI